LIRQEIKPEAMRPDFGMFERPHPTAALFIFPANQTPRFGEKQLLMNLMRVARRVRSTGRIRRKNRPCEQMIVAAWLEAQTGPSRAA
jgi:hypothetical protein